jgi:hypothetical protein
LNRPAAPRAFSDALGHEMITDRTGSPLSERLVRPGVSPLIRIALDEDARAPIRCEPRGGPVEVTPRRRAELKAVAIGWSAKRQILGKTVYNEKNVRVGRIDDIIVTPERAVSYVIVGAGGSSVSADTMSRFRSTSCRS